MSRRAGRLISYDHRIEMLMTVVALALPRFVEMLRERLTAGIYTTEDSLRYLFFAALLEHRVDPNRVVLEYPHPIDSRARTTRSLSTKLVNLCMPLSSSMTGPALEATTNPRPQKAGAALADLTRLYQVPWQGKWFVHLLDGEMERYLGSPRNGLTAIWAAPRDATVTISPLDLSRLSATLRGRAGVWREAITLRPLDVGEVGGGHHLHVFQVQ